MYGTWLSHNLLITINQSFIYMISMRGNTSSNVWKQSNITEHYKFQQLLIIFQHVIFNYWYRNLIITFAPLMIEWKFIVYCYRLSRVMYGCLDDMQQV